jgi:hypothetical protein
MSKLITIPEVKGNFYGGLPYNVSLNIGYSNSPSTLTINVINEKGSYSKPNLSYSRSVNIKIGDLNFNGYLVAYKNNKTVPQKDLELVYKDCSCLLDKYQIGLHKRHGINTKAKFNYKNKFINKDLNLKGNLINYEPPFLVILGEELHPCDINRDGVIDGKDKSLLIDWCDPCLNCPPEKTEFRCTANADFKIFDVGYTFIELLETFGIGVPLVVRNYPKIYRQYTGSLRNVLQSWCQDFGFSFYWNFNASSIGHGIRLIDRSVPISVNYSPDTCDTTDIYEGETIENSFVTNTISYYQREGEIKNYPCNDMTYYTLDCIKLSDFYEFKRLDELRETIRNKEIAIALSYYSDSLRDCYYWFNAYSMYDADAARINIIEDGEELSNPEGVKSKIKKGLGELKIKQVISYLDKSNVPDPLFQECQKMLGDQIEDYNKYSLDNNKDPSKNQYAYYFFIADWNEELHAKDFAWDNGFATEIMGRHWIKITNLPTCGGNGKYSEVTVDSPDGQGKWVSKTLDSIYFPFTNYGHEEGSRIDNLITDTKQNQDKTSDVSVSLADGVEKIYKSLASFIHLERDGKWYPNSNELSNYEGILNYYKRLVFNVVEQDSFISKINPSWAANPNMKLFVVKEVKGPLEVTISSIENFLEPSQLKKIYSDGEDNDVCKYVDQQDVEKSQKVIGSYGLIDNKTAWLTFDGFQCMVPAGGTELLQDVATTRFELTGPIVPEERYKVLVRQSTNIPSCIPKIQHSAINWTSPAGVGASEVNFTDISDDDIRVFSPRTCIPSKELLEKIHQEKNVLTSVSSFRPEKTLEFQIVGAPKNSPSIREGLDGIQIKVSDNGIFTSYSLSDKLRQPPSPEIAALKAAYKQGKVFKSVESYPTKNPANIQSSV